MTGTISEAEADARLKRQIRRLCEIAPRTLSELLHFTGEDGSTLRATLDDMPSIMAIGGVWKVVAP